MSSPASAPPLRRASRPFIATLVVAMRPRQWSKNLLLFAGFLFTLDQRETVHEFYRAVAGFVVFCLLSSVVYLINDVVDRDSDRLHPKKCRRPIASGDLSVPVALVSAFLFGVISLVCAFILGYNFGAIAALYFAVTLSYSFYFKHIVIMDVLVLSAGFVFRAMAGALVIPVSISAWLILCTLMLALFLGLSKRRAELLSIQQSGILGTRRILSEYSASMLDQMIVIVTACCVMSYALYTVESPAGNRHHHYLLGTMPFVVYGIFRYLYLMHKHSLGESPDAVILEDRPTLINLGLWALTTGLIISHALDRVFLIVPR